MADKLFLDALKRDPALIEDPIDVAHLGMFPGNDGLWYSREVGGPNIPLQGVPASRLINTTDPISGGGDLSADRTIIWLPASDVPMGGFKLTGLADGAAGNDAVTLQQLNAAVEGRKIKDPVQWSTTAPILLTGLGTQAGGEWTGPLTAGDRILVKDQAAPADQGIYVAAGGAWTRATDANTGAEITNASTLVRFGATLTGDTFTQTATVTTIGTDPQTWILTGEGATYTADNATLELIGTQFREKDAGTTNAKLATMPANTVKVNATAGAASPTDLALTANTFPGRSSAGNIAAKAMSDAGYAFAAAANTAAETALLDLANTTTKGLQSPTQFNNVANFFGNGFYNVQDHGVLPGNSAATNVTNLNTLLVTTAVDNSVIYFPPGLYQFNAGLTTLTKDFVFMGVRGHSQIALTANCAGNFITCLNTGFYTAFMNLSFINFTTQSAGAVIAGQNNVNVMVHDCFMTGSAAASLFNLIDFVGTNSGNGAVIRNLYANGWSNIGINIASPLDTIYISDLELLGTAGALTAAVGIECTDGGALEIVNSQIIRCGKLVNLAAANTKTVSAVFATNCFFDQGTINALRITGAGTGTVARSHFTGCWFTVASTGSNLKCIQIDSSGSGIHAGIEFQNCWIMNATPGSTGTIKGIEATAIQDITIQGCQMAAWTTDIELTPASAGTCSPVIQGNTMSNTGLLTASTNNIILNAGAVVYGKITIQNNDLGGTFPLQDASTVTNPWQKTINNNNGLVGPGMYSGTITGADQALTASVDNVLTGTLIRLPTNGLRVGNKFIFTGLVRKTTVAGAAAWSFKVKWGTAGTAADAVVVTFTSGTNTGIVDYAPFTLMVEIVTLGAAATMKAFLSYGNIIGTTVTGLGSMVSAPTANVAFNSTSANPYIHLDVTPGAAAVMTATAGTSIVN